MKQMQPIKIKYIAGEERPGPGREGLRQLALRYLAVRGVREPKSFFSRDREPNLITTMRDWDAWVGALTGARERGDEVLVFGDYDVDGLVATSILQEALEAGGVKVLSFVPDRLKDGYGLTIGSLLKAEASVGRIPGLVATVDCGSAGRDAGEWLRNLGKDLIVIDHHDISADCQLECLAHLNPKADGCCADELRNASAGALALWAAEELANAWGLNQWWNKRKEALRLAGAVATICDVMPLMGVNRSLVKTALQTAADSGHTGLDALADACGMKAWDVENVGFRLGPALNALGRMGNAALGLKLMMARDPEDAKLIAVEAAEANRLRKAAVESAIAVSRGMWQLPPQSGCILTASEEYHFGVVGIVAAKLVEEYRVPALVLAKVDGMWKGSGRSVEGVDLGSVIRRGVEDGYLQSGGGHGVAVGLGVTDDKLDNFCKWLETKAYRWKRGMGKRLEVEVIGDVDWFEVADWQLFYSNMEPFGPGHARPNLVARVQSVEMMRPVRAKSDGRVWAWKTAARTEAGRGVELLVKGEERPHEIPQGERVVGVPSWWIPPGGMPRLTLTLDKACLVASESD